MKICRLFSILGLIAAVASPHSVQASAVTNWHTFRNTATTLSGQGTSSPTVGSAAVPASTAVLVGYFDGIALTNSGDRITFSFQINFTDAAAFSSSGDQLRFALFDLNGQTPVTADNTGTAGVDGKTDNWRGYWFGHRGGGGAGANGSIRERPAALSSATDNPFSNTAGDPAPSLGPVGGSPVTLVSSTDPAGGLVFSGVMSLESTPSGVALAGLLSGNGGTNIFMANDNASPFPSTYGAVAYLFGNAMSVDQVHLQNVTVVYSPSNALQITSHPADVSVNPGQPAQFSVAWTGSGIIPTIQWRENNIDIPDATNATYTIPAALLSQSSNTYNVVIGNVFGDSVTSSNATLNVVADTVFPRVLSASSLVSNSVNVVFSEHVDSLTALDGSSYSLAGNSISDIKLFGGTNVLLTLDTPLTGNYTLTVQNVKDLSGNVIATTNVPGFTFGFQGSQVVGTNNGLGFAFNDKIVLYAAGTDISGIADQFQYSFKTASGDFDFAVRVESLLNTDANAKAGLMARINFGDLIFDNSRNVIIEATPGRFIFQFRTNEFGQTLAVSSPRPPTAFPNNWVRLKRIGSVISGYSSTNNVTWDFISSHDTATSLDGAYPNDVLVGLAVTSHSVNQTTQAIFSDFGPYVERPALTITKTGSNIELSWPSSATGFNLQTSTNLTTPVTWATVPSSSGTNQMSFPVSNGNLFFRLSN